LLIIDFEEDTHQSTISLQLKEQCEVVGD